MDSMPDRMKSRFNALEAEVEWLETTQVTQAPTITNLQLNPLRSQFPFESTK